MTSTIFKWASGFDIADGSMTAVLQQPASDLIGPVVRTYGAGGSIYDQGLVGCYHFQMVEDPQTWYDIITQIGLHADDTAEVTFYARDNRLVLKRWNGIAQIPEGDQDIKWSNFFPRDMAIYFVDVEEAA